VIAIITTGAAADQMETISASDKALVQSVCSDILLVHSGTVHFAACSDSLIRTLTFTSQKSTLTAAFAQCQNAGLPMATPAFATCVLDRRNSFEDAPEASNEGDTVVVTEGKLNFPSQLTRAPFTEKTPKEKRRTIEYACAQLGLPPGFLSFSHCVSDLSISLAAEDRLPE
jgi:hypothetical protein